MPSPPEPPSSPPTSSAAKIFTFLGGGGAPKTSSPPLPKCALVAPLLAPSHEEASSLLTRLASSAAAAGVHVYVGLVITQEDHEKQDHHHINLSKLLSGFSTCSHLCVVQHKQSASSLLASVWESLGKYAFDHGNEYLVLCHSAKHALSLLLLCDKTSSNNKLSKTLNQDFHILAKNLCLAGGKHTMVTGSKGSKGGSNTSSNELCQHHIHGFGCVALLNEGESTCEEKLKAKGNGHHHRWAVALHRTHLQLFDGGKILPYNNSDNNDSSDKFLYSIYAKVNAARFSSLQVPFSCGGEVYDDDDWHFLGTGSGGADPTATTTTTTMKATTATLRAYLTRQGLDISLLPPSLDAVVPTYRVDMKLLDGICCSTIPANQGTVTHVVVDNPDKVAAVCQEKDNNNNKNLLTVLQMQRALSTYAKDSKKMALIHVNPTNRGVTYSRNHGVEASEADWIVFQDDDVVPDPKLLQAYTAAIMKHTAAGTGAGAGDDKDKENVLGFCGMIHFPTPFNGFTAALRMSGVPNAFEIAQLTPTPVWGCTANVCMRNGPWLRFTEDWEKTGGGEDIDFFLRLQRDVGGAIISVPEAAVTHPWWNEGTRRAYWHFYLWGKGDGRLQKLYPQHCYRACPNSVEMLALLSFVFIMIGLFVGLLACLLALLGGGGGGGGGTGAAGLSSFASLSSLGVYWCCVVLAILEVDMVGNVVSDLCLLRPVNSESLHGWARYRAAMEAALILFCCEWGRLEYHLTHEQGRWHDVCMRFDFYCGCIPEARRAWKKTYAWKFAGYLIYGLVAQGWWLFATGEKGGNWLLARGILLAHTGLVMFIGALFVFP